ncbi:MAG TPA: YdcF family protein [Actinomycetales bacterium]|nr:YdcF family protein [Actinomycetales bacterium]
MGALGRVVGRLIGLLLLLAIAAAVITAVRIVIAANDDERRASETIVVLGAAQYNGEPQEYLTARLDHSALLFTDGVAPRVLTTGGNRPGDNFTEAEAGSEYLQALGVPADAIVPVGEGNDTLESMIAVAEVMHERGWTSAVVVTDPWHTLRATEMLGDQGIDAVGSPTRTGPANDGLWSATKYTARETAAYLYYLYQRLTS